MILLIEDWVVVVVVIMMVIRIKMNVHTSKGSRGIMGWMVILMEHQSIIMKGLSSFVICCPYLFPLYSPLRWEKKDGI